MAVINGLVDLFKALWRLLLWWVVILPWEEGIRVRAGKKRKRLRPGLRFRIPYVDAVYKQSNRLRWCSFPIQTVTSSDGFTLTISGQLGYRIANIDLLYDTLHQAESGVRSMTQGAIAEYVYTHSAEECTPMKVASGAGAMLQLQKYGLEVERLQLTTFCRVRTHRFIMDREEGIYEDALNTMRDDTPKPV